SAVDPNEPQVLESQRPGNVPPPYVAPWSHHRARACADEYWVFATLKHDADRGRVTALIGQGTGAFSGIPRHSEALPVSASPEARRRCPPSGNQMATPVTPTRVIPGCSGTCVEDQMGSILVPGLDQKTIQRLKERAPLSGRSRQQEAKALLE